MNPRVLITAFGLKLWMISVNTFGLVKCHVAGSFPSSDVGFGTGSAQAPPTKTFPPEPQVIINANFSHVINSNGNSVNIGVSKNNSGTPKWMVYNEKPY